MLSKDGATFASKKLLGAVADNLPEVQKRSTNEINMLHAALRCNFDNVRKRKQSL